MSQTNQNAPEAKNSCRWEPLSEELMDLVYEKILRLKTLGRMGEIYLQYQCEGLPEYEVDLEIIGLWLDVFKETVEQIGLIIA